MAVVGDLRRALTRLPDGMPLVIPAGIEDWVRANVFEPMEVELEGETVKALVVGRDYQVPRRPHERARTVTRRKTLAPIVAGRPD